MTQDIDIKDAFLEKLAFLFSQHSACGLLTGNNYSVVILQSLSANVQVCMCELIFVWLVFLTCDLFSCGKGWGAGGTASLFFFCHTRRQLCYQHGISAWHRMSQWHNEIKEVSQACPHCVLDVWKPLLCNFCNLGERYIFQRRRGVKGFSTGDQRTHTLLQDPRWEIFQWVYFITVADTPEGSRGSHR